MPCETRGLGDYAYVSHEFKAEADKVTRLLCEILTEWEKAKYPMKISTEAKLWWEKHKEADRKAQEAAKKEAEYQAALKDWESKRPKRK